MPGNKRPSYLKRQKEQKRAERAAAKREARQMKKKGKSALRDGESFETTDDTLSAGEMTDDTTDVAETTDVADEGVTTP